MNSKESIKSGKYDRVMSRVLSKSKPRLETRKVVTRHDHGSTSRTSVLKSVSNVSSWVSSDLPVVLNDYEPEQPIRSVKKRSQVVKPRRTLNSLDPPLSLIRNSVLDVRPAARVLTTPRSAPSLGQAVKKHVDFMKHSNVSETKLRELQDEIRSYNEFEKFTNTRKKLFKNCGIVLDDSGMVTSSKSIQASPENEPSTISPRFPTEPELRNRYENVILEDLFN